MRYATFALVFLALVACASAISIDVTDRTMNIAPTASADTLAWHELVMQGASQLLIPPSKVENIRVSASTVEGPKIKIASGTLTDGSEVKLELAKRAPLEAEARFMYRSASTPTPAPLSPGRGERVAVSPSLGPQLGPWTTELVVAEVFGADSLTVNFNFPSRQDLNFQYTIKSKGEAATGAPPITKSAITEPIAPPTVETYSVEFKGFGQTITGDLSTEMQNPPVVQEIIDLLKRVKAKPQVIHAADSGLVAALFEESSMKPLAEAPAPSRRERVLCAIATGLGGLFLKGAGAAIVGAINEYILTI